MKIDKLLRFPWARMKESRTSVPRIEVLDYFEKKVNGYKALENCPAEIREVMIRKGMSGPLNDSQMLALIEYFREKKEKLNNIIPMNKTSNQ